MNLIDAIDAIGGDTIPEELIPTIQAAFAYVEARVHDRYLIGMLAPSKTQTIFKKRPFEHQNRLISSHSPLESGFTHH